MATKTIDHMDFYVAIAPYKTDENGDQTFDSLRVSVGYRKGRGFYVGYHPGWGDERMWGCLFDFSNNPLTDGASIDVEPATKNSAKRIAEMTESLKMAKDVIAALFDDREWEKLKAVLHNVARLGYVERYKEQAEKYLAERVSKRYEKAVKPTEPVVKQVDVMGLMGALQTKGKAKLSDFATPIESESNEKENKAAIKREESDACIDSTEREQAQTKFNSNQETMAQNVKAADLIGKTIVVGDNQATIVIKSVDGDKLSGEFTKDGKTTPMSFPVSQLHGMTEKGLWKLQTSDVIACHTQTFRSENPQTSDVTTEADVQEVQDIVPVVTPKKSDGGSKTADVPQTSDIKPQTSNQPAAKVEPIGKPKQEKPKKNTNPTNQTNKGGKAASEREQNGARTSSAEREQARGNSRKYVYSTYQTSKGKTGAKITGVSETDAAYQQAAAIHASGSYERDKDGNKHYYLLFGPRYAEAAKKVCELLNAGKPIEDAIAVVNAATENLATKREEWKQKREERKAQASAVSPQPSKGYSDKDVAEMLRKVLAGGDIPEDIKAILAKAA